jgi:hypothetical protein
VRTTLLLRGLTAGLIAGVLAGLVGLVVGEPSIEAAIAIEEAAGHAAGTGEVEMPRAAQRAGLVIGSGLLGAVLGLGFAVAFAWSAGRMAGDAWRRSLTLGAVSASAIAVLPALALPANPPAVGDPGSVGARTLAYLLVAVIGVLLAVAGRLAALALARRGVAAPVRQTLVGLGVLAAAATVLVVQPIPPVPVGDVPADVLWAFRVASLGVQLVLHIGIAVAFGLLSHRAARRTARDAIPAAGA